MLFSFLRVIPLTSYHQSEHEHKTPKARYKRTDRKHFIKQIAAIERRQTRIRRICEKRSTPYSKPVPRLPQGHHHIARSEDDWDHIGTFLIRHQGDPATYVRLLFLIEFPALMKASLEFSSKAKTASPPPRSLRSTGPPKSQSVFI